jgi:hypothetical protein
MGNNFRSLRVFIVSIALFLACLYGGVAFLGLDWGAQGRYLLTLGYLLLTILLCAGALLGVLKLVGWLWERGLQRRRGRAGERDDQHRSNE